MKEMNVKPETAESWIEYFLNQEAGTPIPKPAGDLNQWDEWWQNLKAGNPLMPPHTTMEAITEQYPVPQTSIPFEAQSSQEKPKPKKKREPSAGWSFF